MRRGSRSGGQALVEFALIAPVFFILFIALADMGRGLLAYTELAMGSRAAARQAVLQYNAGSNGGPNCAAPCQAPGVIPIIKQEAGFGFPVVDASTGPANVNVSDDSDWNGANNAPPLDLTLSNAAAVNTIYVYTYEFDQTAYPTRTVRWPPSTGAARVSGHQMVVVDLKMSWTSVTLSLIGIGPTLTLDSQTIQRLEY